MSMCFCPISHGATQHKPDCFRNPNNFEYRAPYNATPSIDYRGLADTRAGIIEQLALNLGRAEAEVTALKKQLDAMAFTSKNMIEALEIELKELRARKDEE